MSFTVSHDDYGLVDEKPKFGHPENWILHNEKWLMLQKWGAPEMFVHLLYSVYSQDYINVVVILLIRIMSLIFWLQILSRLPMGFR